MAVADAPPITDDMLARFVAELRRGGYMNRAASAAGASAWRLNQRRKRDPDFDKEVRRALADYRARHARPHTPPPAPPPPAQPVPLQDRAVMMIGPGDASEMQWSTFNAAPRREKYDIAFAIDDLPPSPRQRAASERAWFVIEHPTLPWPELNRL